MVCDVSRIIQIGLFNKTMVFIKSCAFFYFGFVRFMSLYNKNRAVVMLFYDGQTYMVNKFHSVSTSVTWLILHCH